MRMSYDDNDRQDEQESKEERGSLGDFEDALDDQIGGDKEDEE